VGDSGKKISVAYGDDTRLTARVLAAYSRLVLVGADGQELFPAGGWLRGGSRSATSMVGQVEESLAGEEVLAEGVVEPGISPVGLVHRRRWRCRR